MFGTRDIIITPAKAAKLPTPRCDKKGPIKPDMGKDEHRSDKALAVATDL
jgi:hypothetical protein